MLKSVIALTFVNVMWGLSFLMSEHALQTIPPMTLSLARCALSLCALFPALLMTRDKTRKLQARDIPAMLLSGIAGVTLYYFFEYNGLMRTSTVSASLILAAIPVMTLCVEYARKRGKPPVRLVICAVGSLGGVALVLGDQFSPGSLIGDLLVFGAAASWVLYLFVSKRLRKDYSSLSMNAWQALAAFLTMLPLAYLERGAWQPPPVSALLCVAGLGLVCSAVCYCLYGGALRALKPTVSSMFINIIPLTTMLAEVARGGNVTVWQALGGALIIGSTALSVLQNKEAEA